MNEEIGFERIRLESTQPSYYSDWPTQKNTTAKYKFSSLWLEIGRDLISYDRQTYSLLEWVGDVGGLADGLRIVFGGFLGAIAKISLKRRLLSFIFGFEKSNN